MAGVVDRLFTYARGESLSAEQRQTLEREGREPESGGRVQDLVDAFHAQVERALTDLRQTQPHMLSEPRAVGRRQLPSTVMGLLFHAAEHVQRHVGQLLVTARMQREPVSTLLQIDHVELFVADRHEAARWYEHALGLRIVPAYEAWATDGGPLMISSDEGSTKLALFAGQPDACSETAAFQRVAFRLAADGFAAFIGRLPELALVDARGRAVTRESVVDHRQAFSIYFNDPWTHRLEVTTYDYDHTAAFLRSSPVPRDAA
jgi:catechol 2,3-dioxygenase-like lactoylglutathione lyase family enzyme